jgi:hypothetical protein
MDKFLACAVFGAEDIVKSMDDGCLGVEEFSVGAHIFDTPGTPMDPVQKLFAAGQSGSLAKNASNESWDAPLSKTVMPSSFPQRSDERFEKVCKEIRKIFGDRTEEAEEAIALAKQMRAEARAEAIAAA